MDEEVQTETLLIMSSGWRRATSMLDGFTLDEEEKDKRGFLLVGDGL